jgi:glycosyltransferase involved in cell wall biosynthesis
MMKILLTNHFPLMGSGSGVYVANVARELAKAGHEVVALYPDTEPAAPGEHAFSTDTILCPDPSRPAAKATDLSFPFPCFTTHPRSNRTFYALNDRELAEYLAVFESRIRSAADKAGVELIHAQHLWVTSALAVRTGRPCVVTCHGTDLLGYRAAHGLRHMAHESADGARRVVAVSESTAQEVRQIFNIGAGRLVALPSGVDGNTFRPVQLDRAQVFAELGLPPADGPVVAYGGKLACFKGPDVLVDAAAIYERQMPQVTTVIAGDGSDRKSLESMARALHLRNVRFAGWLDQEKLAKLYAVSDLAVVPSREEPFGLAAIEALACGLPVVATRVGGLPEYVDDSVGRLVNPDSAGELAHAVCAELALGARRVKGKAAAQRGTGFTWASHVAKLLDLYSQATRA